MLKMTVEVRTEAAILAEDEVFACVKKHQKITDVEISKELNINLSNLVSITQSLQDAEKISACKYTKLENGVKHIGSLYYLSVA